MTGGAISNCYVEGKIVSTQAKDGNGMSAILGTGEATPQITIENCITKVEYTNNVSHRLNGDIIGLALSSNTVLRNNVSLSSGTNFYNIHGSSIHGTSNNNYELVGSGLTSNASGDRVKTIAKTNLTDNFFKDEANFNEGIWDITNISFDKPPHLKGAPNSEEEIRQTNNELYIPEYSRISKITGFNKSKEIAYHNLQKLMPFYESKYLVIDGGKLANDDVLNTKIVKHVIPYSEGKMVTYLTSKDYNKITNIKVVFKDYTMKEYPVEFKEWKQNIAIYQIGDTDLYYAYDNYTIEESASIVNTISDYIKGVDYTATLDVLTPAADSRLYKDHYNEFIKAEDMAKNIAMQLMQNGEDVLTLNNELLNKKIKQDLIDSGKLNKILYAYNYYHRWYDFEIGGSKVSDIILFEGKMYSDLMTLDNLTNEVFSGNIAIGSTSTFYVNNLSKYTGSSNVGYFLDYIIKNIGGYEDIDDWFTEYFGARNILTEVSVDNRPEMKYRGWYKLKLNQRMILPVITLPPNSGYMISGPAHLQFGPQQLYHQHPETAAGNAEVRRNVNNHVNLVKRHFNTLAGSFDPGRWNNYCIMVYDCTRIITGYENSYFPGTNVVIGTKPVTAQQKAGTTQNPFCKNFSEVLGLWQPPGNSAGVANNAGFLWFQARPGLSNFDTWTHEFEHALDDKIMLFQRKCRMPAETYTEGNVQQKEEWSENNISQDVGPYYFNTTYYLNKEGNGTQNLTPERIETREKLENYYKGQQNAIDLLDYVSAKAFIRLTPEEQAKIATRITDASTRTVWRTITAEQAETMNLTTLEALWDNRIILRPNNAWGVSVRGLIPPTSQWSNDYGYESIWVTRWYISHYDGSYPSSLGSKRNLFEMLGYAGIDGYVTYGSKRSANDLDAIQKITLAKTGKAMNWKEYKLSRYAEIESHLDNKYVDIDFMIDQFTDSLKADAAGNNRNLTSSTNLRKIYYHYLKRTTNDFIADPYGTDVEITHIKTAQELVDKINSKPYGYYIIDNDLDFTDVTSTVTNTFMGTLEGNNHKIIGNTNSIFNKIRYGYVRNLNFEGTKITNASIGILAKQTQMSVLENIQATNVNVNFAGRNEVSVIGGSLSTVSHSNCNVERKVNHITNSEDFVNKIKADPSGLFVVDADIDFTGYTSSNSAVITETFTGIINGNGFTISNLNNKSLFKNFRGTVDNLKVKDFTNTSTGRGNGDFVTAFTEESFTAKFTNLRFENITLSGRNNVSVVSGMDGRDNANSVFENISVKNANVTGTGVYVSCFVGRKWGGSIKNIFVQGTMTVEQTENGGLIGALQQNCAVENIITDVDISKPRNTYTNITNSVFNGSMIGNIYAQGVKNSIAFGNMTGYTQEQTPYKFVGAVQNSVISYLTNCYEVEEEIGNSRAVDATAGKLNKVSRANLNDAFYEGLGYDKTLWDYSTIQTKGYPELK